MAREILHHGSLRHPFVVSLFEVFLTRRFVAIVMEFAEGGDLFHYVNAQHQKRLTEEMARYFFQQLVVGLQYIHGRVSVLGTMRPEALAMTRKTLAHASKPGCSYAFPAVQCNTSLYLCCINSCRASLIVI